MNPRVDFYFNEAKNWYEELRKLRKIVLDCGLTEELKWGVPCYTLNAGRKATNIVLIHVFKEYCAILFFKGALLQDTSRILVQQTRNVQAARQVRFTNVRDVIKLEPLLKAYIHEAMEVEKAGLKISLKKTSAYSVPQEFRKRLEMNPELKTAFNALTPGRQRAYLLYFSAPKQSKTRESRVEKTMKQILSGKGLNDR